MTRLVESPRSAFEALLAALRIKDPVELVYEYADRGSLHVWLISHAFDGLDYPARRDLVKPVVGQLPPSVSLRISLLFYVTPDEFEADYAAAPQQFPVPVDEDVNDGPFRVTRAAGQAA